MCAITDGRSDLLMHAVLCGAQLKQTSTLQLNISLQIGSNGASGARSGGCGPSDGPPHAAGLLRPAVNAKIQYPDLRATAYCTLVAVPLYICCISANCALHASTAAKVVMFMACRGSAVCSVMLPRSCRATVPALHWMSSRARVTAAVMAVQKRQVEAWRQVRYMQ